MSNFNKGLDLNTMFEGRVVLSCTCHSRRATANDFSAVEIQGFFFFLFSCVFNCIGMRLNPPTFSAFVCTQGKVYNVPNKKERNKAH